MKINVLLAPELADELYFTGKTTLVIDVLRASNTIITALENGAKEVIPVASVDAAARISKGLYGGSTILGGERNTKKIEGFTLGNSPREYSPENVKSKTIVFFTTNGSKAAFKAKFSANLFICAFINIGAVVRHIHNSSADIEILCAGNPNAFAMEDVVCAGMVIDEIGKLRDDVFLSDASKAALTLYKSAEGDILKLLRETDHGKVLINNGFDEDIIFCSRINTTESIPYLSGNVIKLLSGK